MTELEQRIPPQQSALQPRTAIVGENNAISHSSSHQPTAIIHDFLTVPGIAGIALIDGSTIPRLYSADPQLQIHQPKTFLANVTPILRSLAPEVQQLEFFFGTYRLYVCRMSYGFTIAVLTHCTIQWHNSSQDLRLFCQTVQAHLKISIPLLETWASARNHPHPIPHPHASALPSPVRAAHPAPSSPSSPAPSSPAPSAPAPSAAPSAPNPSNPALTLQDYLNAFNHLTTIAARTLGTTIITSQIKRSRPDLPDLPPINISPKGHLTSSTLTTLDPHQLKALRQWTQDFRSQCSKIIRDFDTTAQQAGLTIEEAAILKGT